MPQVLPRKMAATDTKIKKSRSMPQRHPKAEGAQDRAKRQDRAGSDNPPATRHIGRNTPPDSRTPPPASAAGGGEMNVLEKG